MKGYLFQPEFELFDLGKDPIETTNLAANEDYKEVLGELKAKLKSFQKSTNDPWLTIWDHDNSMQGTCVGL